MEWILDEIATGQRLIIGKDDAVVLGVALVTPLHRPFVCLLLLGRKASHVISEHVKIRPVVNDPARQLLRTAATQHHPSRIEAATVKETGEMRIGALQERSDNCQSCDFTKQISGSPSRACGRV